MYIFEDGKSFIFNKIWLETARIYLTRILKKKTNLKVRFLKLP